MIRTGAIAIGVLAVVVVCGCNVATPGTTRNLGRVDYASAFATAREVMAEHFSVASADPATGIIESRPRPAQVRGERLLGGSPARHLAKLRIRHKDGQVVAVASVALQREGSAIHRTMYRPGENYDSVPNRTPAEDTAAMTPEQTEVWRTERYDHALERKILDKLYRTLHPAKK